MAGRSHFFEPSISMAELHVAWAGITFARLQLHAERIFLEDDSTIVISWIQEDARQLKGHLLIQNA